MKLRLYSVIMGLCVFYTGRAGSHEDLSAVATCNAGFTYKIDSVAGLPVYTFTADEVEDTKTYVWEFEAMEIITGGEVEYIFFDAGTWRVTLTVIDGEDTCTTYQNVSAFPPDYGKCFFNVWETGDLGIEAETWLPSYWDDMSYLLDFGDGVVIKDTAEFGVFVAHVYASPGAYQLCQTMSKDSCTYCKEIQVGPADTIPCNAAFNYEVDSMLSAASYIFSASEPDTTLTSFLWKIEGGFEAFGPELHHTFSDGGLWNVTLEVIRGTDTCSTTQVVNVAPLPFCEFDYELNDSLIWVYAPLWVRNKNYSWNFGDGTILADSSVVSHVYAASGTYDVCINITDSLIDCSFCREVVVSLSDTIPCNAAFNHTKSIINPLSYSFTASDSFKKYDWNFGDGSSISTDSLSIDHTFSSPGEYEVCLNVTNDTDSCTYCQTIEVKAISDSLTISGQLFADLTPVHNGLIVLYFKENENWIKVDQTYSESGIFAFSQLHDGDYLLHARIQNNSDDSYIPTYFVNGISWEDAYQLKLAGSVSELNITLIRSQLLGNVGQGVLRGRVSSSSEDEDIVLLRDRESGQVLRWTAMQKGSAEFDFEYLPFGIYEVRLERPSYSVSRIVQITEDHLEHTNIELSPEVITSINKPGLDFMSVYPTQIDDKIFVSNNGYKSEKLHIELYNVSGEVLFDSFIDIQIKETKELYLPNLVRGLHLLRIGNEEGIIKVMRIVK